MAPSKWFLPYPLALIADRCSRRPRYGDAPWVFKGRALYQLQLIKVKHAQRFVPPEMPLVQLFGYTLGGTYLARYSASPVGAFDELVVLAGLVWDSPTSAAWAGRVYVNQPSAYHHGRRDVGLPSRKGGFAGVDDTDSWWGEPSHDDCEDEARSFGLTAPKVCPIPGAVVVSDAQSECVFGFRLPKGAKPREWRRAPRIRMALPSFSGATETQPDILRYALQLKANVQPVGPQKVHVVPRDSGKVREEVQALQKLFSGPRLLSLRFDNMAMNVGKPIKRSEWREAKSNYS